MSAERAVGASSIVTTSTAKVERCGRLGADVVVDYTTEDFVAVSKGATAGRGVDVVLDMGRGIVHAVPGLVVAGLILLLARAVVGLLGRMFHRVETGHLTVTWLRPDAATPTRRVTSWLIWIFALAMAYPYLPGAETEAFKGMSVLVGLMLSLGASSFVAQVAAGLILTYSNTLRKGEYVRVGEHEGTVVEVGAFNTRIRTGLGEEIVLPNNIIANAYSTRDVNLNGNVQYAGSGNDRDPILVNVGSTTPNNLRLQQLP